MGMSTYIQAFVSPDDPTYKKHAKILIACSEAGVDLPKQTAEYFGNNYPELCFLDDKLEIKIPYVEYLDDERSGFEILVENIPVGTYKIRFVNSW